MLVHDTKHTNFSVTFSMVELYCQRYIDLLDCGAQKSLKLRMTADGEVFLENLREEPITNIEEVNKLLSVGLKARHQRATAMNAESSRSHVICIVKVSTTCRASNLRRQGKLMFVDLAGSERVKRSEVQGDGMKEAIEVNRSLSALGDVLGALSRGESHVPYRNHELTQLMQDSIGGSAKTLMFLNLSPATCNVDEVKVSLEFAQKVRGVTNTVQPSSTSFATCLRSASPSPYTSAFARTSTQHRLHPEHLAAAAPQAYPIASGPPSLVNKYRRQGALRLPKSSAPSGAAKPSTSQPQQPPSTSSVTCLRSSPPSPYSSTLSRTATPHQLHPKHLAAAAPQAYPAASRLSLPVSKYRRQGSSRLPSSSAPAAAAAPSTPQSQQA